MKLLSKKTALIAVIVLAVVLNFQIFCYAYPQTFKPQFPDLARDFSAYYMGEWRLLHNPTQLFLSGTQPGDYPIVGNSQPYKYTPNFLLMFMPFIALSYQNALCAFNAVQFLSVAAMAFCVYKLTKNKPLIAVTVAVMIVLVNPLVFLHTNTTGDNTIVNYLHWRIYSLHEQTVSPTYYLAYQLGNAHILQTSLLVGALYFGFAKKPWLSALLFTFGSFDPRAALFALPLLLWYNKGAIKKFVAGSAVFLVATNMPFFFYYGVGFLFLQSVFSGHVASDFYMYDLLPFCAVAAIAALEIVTAVYNLKIRGLNVKSANTDLPPL
jgi:hypothetical protein